MAGRGWIVAVAGLVVLSGCAARMPPPVAGYADTSAIGTSPTIAVPADAVVLGPVEGVSCAHSPLPKAASRDEATAKLKQAAAALGATGVSHFRLTTRGVSLSCVYSQVAKGIAYRTLPHGRFAGS